MPTVVDQDARTAAHRLARASTEVFAPAVFAAVMPLVVAVHSTAPAVAVGFGWGLLAVLFCSAVPYAIIWWGVRRGALTDHHIRVRSQRRRPLLLGSLSVLVGLTALVLLGAPPPLVALVVGMLAILAAILAVNQVWKISAHAAISAASVSALIFVFGLVATPLLGVVAVVGWSRVRLRDHTAAQVVAGTVLGPLVGAPFFVLLG
ncbi:phosphatase PAP2 family protein [Micromonospora sp. Llam7]|uniref:phosphoesterase PA-phosphatase n=1 Tax=Micromonospora tarapacensis TaxID=2835305 RepID=UPI001C834EB3|nr:phosphoesterase PA-phosphatase [Micromonospora tarapacensis]MBX7267143.1 phosphatase PAP2 family protein [Micromonospora tarapacensis]